MTTLTRRELGHAKVKDVRPDGWALVECPEAPEHNRLSWLRCGFQITPDVHVGDEGVLVYISSSKMGYLLFDEYEG